MFEGHVLRQLNDLFKVKTLTSVNKGYMSQSTKKQDAKFA